jgi:ElaB/YqjD/DUF883 family membrane-anchored ribosome-binding protein
MKGNTYMTPATVDAPKAEAEPSVHERAIDAARHVAHLSHEAQLLKSLAADAVDDGVHAAKRAIKSVRRRVQELDDLKDEAAHRVKRQPFKAVGIAVGVGFVLGVAVSFIGSRFGRAKSTCNDY